MTPRAAALRILVEVEHGAWSDRLLAVREPRFDDPRDRHFLHALVLASLRWQGAIDQVVAPHVHGGLDGLEPVVRAALRLGVAQARPLALPDPIAVDTAIGALKELAGPRAAGLVNAVLRRALAHAAALDPASTIPAWLLRRWEREYGAGAALALAVAALAPARPFAVARRDRGGRDALAEALAGEGVTTRSADRHPDGLVVLDGAPQATAAFRRGDLVLVDEGAALVALLARPDDGRPVADLAAAPGGKAALLAQDARVAALDLVAGRTALLRDTLVLRAPAGRARAARGDASRPPFAPGAFATVLLDAPCTGTGTLRRRPEKRQRLTPADVTACATRQAELLDAAARLVAPRGALVYAVCSLEAEEGREQVAAFLARHGGFRAEDPAERLGAAGRGLTAGDPPLLVTRPDRETMDGFVAARLVRN